MKKRTIAGLALAFVLLASCQAKTEETDTDESQGSITSTEETDHFVFQDNNSSYQRLSAVINQIRGDITSDGIKGEDITSQGSVFDKYSEVIRSKKYTYESVLDFVVTGSLIYDKYSRDNDKGYHNSITARADDEDLNTTEKMVEGIYYSNIFTGNEDCFISDNTYSSVDKFLDDGMVPVADSKFLQAYYTVFGGKTYVCEERDFDDANSNIILYFLDGELVAKMVEISDNQKLYTYYLSFSADVNENLFDVPTNIADTNEIVAM